MILRFIAALMVVAAGSAAVRDYRNPQPRHTKFFAQDNPSVESALRPLRTAATTLPFGIELLEFAEAGHSIAAGLSGDLLFVNYSSSLVIYDTSESGIPVRVAYLPVGENFYEIELDGSLAYLAGSEGLLTIVSFADPSHPEIVSAKRFGTQINAMAINNGLLFLAQGWNSSRIIDASNPASPITLSSYDGAAAGGAVDIAYENDHMFVAGYAYGIRIFNVANPAAPVLVGSFPIPGPDATGIVVSNGFAYSIGTFSGVLRAIDVSQPSLPQQVGALVIGAHLWDIELSGQNVCVTRQGDFDSSLEIVSVSNPANPVVISSTDIDPIVAPYVIAASNDRVAVTSFDRFTSVFDISDVGEVALRGTVESLGSVTGMTSATDWLAFPLYQNGVMLVDPDNFQIRHRMEGNHWEIDSNFATSDGSFVLISGLDSVFDPDQSGISIIDITDPVNAVERGFLPTDYYGDIVLNGTLAYFQDNGVAVIDWSNPSSPQMIGSAIGGGRYLELDSPYLIVGGNNTTFDILDVSTPTTPVVVSHTTFGWDLNDVDISNGFAFAAGRRLQGSTITNGVWGYDLSDPTNPVEIASFTLSANPGTLNVVWPHIFLSAQDGLHVIDVSEPESPLEVGFIDCGPLEDDVVVEPPYIYALSNRLMKFRANAFATGIDHKSHRGLRLLSCYPNPFNPETVIRWSVDSTSPVSLGIYDVRGALVRVLVDRTMTPGDFSIGWDGRDKDGRRLASGVYFCRLSNGIQHVTTKMVLLK